MKKGFTLIELLSVIIILGIILAIAVPMITNVMNTSRIETYKNNIEKVMIKADEYISENISVLPTSIGETKEISLVELKNNNYIKDLKSPFNNDNCSGYILVTKTELDYELIPYINCYENINNSIEDKLVLHYTFDEFQEPTINVSLNDGQSGTSPIWGDGSPSLSVIDEDITFRNKKVVRYITGTSGNFYINGSAKLSSATTSSNWTSTFYIKRVDNTPITNVGTYMYVSNNTNINLSVAAELVEDGWYKVKRTRDNLTSGYVGLIGCYGLGASTEYYIAEWMLEPKSYDTDYISGSREGTVYDLSTNSNHSTLGLTTTPRWVFDEERNTGNYLFDGINNYIDILSPNTINPDDELTISTWVKFNDVSDSTRVGNIFGNYPSTPHLNFEGHTNGKVRFYWNAGQIDVFGTSDLRGDWHHVLVVRNKVLNYLKVFIDNELELETIAGDNLDFNTPFRIGDDFRSGTSIPFNGYIDDVRIYNRALSEEEIKLLYNISK